MNDILPSDEIQEGLRGVLELLPFVYVAVVLMAVIAFGIIRFDGSTIKYYQVYVLFISMCLAGVIYLLEKKEN